MVELEKYLKETQALLTGHFILSSGNHSSHYLQCARLFQYPDKAEEMGKALAEKLNAFSPQGVISPALGGVILGHEVARSLNVRHIFAERHDGVMRLCRGFEIKPEERWVIVEDVVTTGKSVQEVIQIIQRHQGLPVAVGSLILRQETSPFTLPHCYLMQRVFPLYPPSQCPLCHQGIPAVKSGSRTHP